MYERVNIESEISNAMAGEMSDHPPTSSLGLASVVWYWTNVKRAPDVLPGGVVVKGPTNQVLPLVRDLGGLGGTWRSQAASEPSKRKEKLENCL